MKPEIAVSAVVEVVGQLRRYLMQRQFSAYDAVPYRFDGHAMVRLLQNVEQESLPLMQQRTAQVLAALELGYQFAGAPVVPQRQVNSVWGLADTARLVGSIPPIPAYVARYKLIFERAKM